MPLTATSFTYVVLPTAGQVPVTAGTAYDVRKGPNYEILGKTRIVRVRCELNNASETAAYPTSGGIPLSTAKGDWGMIRNMEYLELYGQGILEDPTGLATEAPMFVMRTPATGGNYLVGFSALATGAGATSMATTRKGFPELPTTWTPTLSPYTQTFYIKAYGW